MVMDATLWPKRGFVQIVLETDKPLVLTVGAEQPLIVLERVKVECGHSS